MRVLLAATLIGVLIGGDAKASDFPTSEFKGQLQEVFERIYSGKRITLKLDSCTEFYCGYELGDDILLRSYSAEGASAAVTELSAVLYTSRESSQSELAFSAFAASCMALLNIVVPEITEKRTTELAKLWIGHDEREKSLDADGVSLLSELLPDQRICTIYL